MVAMVALAAALAALAYAGPAKEKRSVVSLPRLERAPGTVTLRAGFDGGSAAPLTPQCAPRTPSASPRYRGTYAIESSIVGKGSHAIEITLPKDPNPSTYPLEACDLMTPPAPVGLGTDSYMGLMVYVPVGWTIPDGVFIYQIHFQNIYGAPIMLSLHPDHVSIQLETGACHNFATADPGCVFRSNPDFPSSSQTLPGYYAIPPGGFKQGAWNEIVLHVQWSSRSGQIQSYYRTKGGGGWVESSNITGIPTVQWDVTRGCCSPTYHDEVMAYTFAHDTPLSVWLDNLVDGTSLRAVEAAMP
jgi:Polysaccharide lyase